MKSEVSARTEDFHYISGTAMIGDHPYPCFDARIVLRYLGYWVRPEELLKIRTELELDDQCLAQDFVPAWKMLGLYERACNLLPSPASGCRLGYSFELDDLGDLGEALRLSKTLLGAFQIQNHYHQLFGSFTDIHTQVSGDILSVKHVNVNRIDPKVMQFIIEVGMGSVLSLGSQLVDKTVPMKLVTFTQPASEEVRAIYESVFNCQVQFGAQTNSWQADISQLNLLVGDRGATGLQSVENLCENLMARANSHVSLTQDIVEILTSSGGDYPDLELIASALNMSGRTLRRKLNDLGTNYQSLLNKVRCRLAIAQLVKGDRKPEDIADELGYSDVANFRNAFKRWLGLTPGEIAKILR